MVDNRFVDENGGMGVAGAAPSCSSMDAWPNGVCTGDRGGPPWAPATPGAAYGSVWIGCNGNATQQLGRDCAPFSNSSSDIFKDIGSYRGAMNTQLAWRRNTMGRIYLTGPSGPTWAKAGAIPLVDGGVIEGNRNVNGGPIELDPGGPAASAEGGWDSQAPNVFVRN